ncbi:MAG: UDP-N-acetylmuramate dehydrogenase [Candidatus Latescibacteria bacterium]|nr:UDP-N-acetylmuramate dehydrogenase [Candidatus Latescibacterota bacterium]
MDDRLKQELRAICRGEVRFDEPMARHTSFGVGGPADALLLPGDLDEVRAVCRRLVSQEIPILPLGDGTNMLVSDAGWRGAVICLTKGLRVISFQEETGSAEAGASLSVFSRQCQRAGLAGMEWACSVPGTLGGAMRGNAGAFGGETFDRLLSVEALDMGTGQTLLLKKEDLPHSYRRCDLPPGLLLLRGAFALAGGRPEEIEARMDDILSRRKATQPLYERNAGCIFKNPAGSSAGLLIDQAGCKGLGVGGAVVSDLHANFMVNRGGATAADVLTLIERIRDRVRQHAGIELETEIRTIGESP